MRLVGKIAKFAVALSAYSASKASLLPQLGIVVMHAAKNVSVAQILRASSVQRGIIHHPTQTPVVSVELIASLVLRQHASSVLHLITPIQLERTAFHVANTAFTVTTQFAYSAKQHTAQSLMEPIACFVGSSAPAALQRCAPSVLTTTSQLSVAQAAFEA